ncbi:MAG: bacteriohemerythrin [Gammaproteobacteria bacterium]|nr:bacteriohemerythrin [Gammaproteobacteria bacterium]MDH5777609.1 bacteriohemerythrin [Gammaproteobacteria bacterium]
MSYFEFDDSLKVGNKLIDQEHAVLIEYINLLQKSVENEISETLLKQVLDGLIDYTKTHFFVEEELMKALDYPEASVHLSAHEAFCKKIDELKAGFDQGNTNISGDALAFLKDWLTGHILKVDKRLSDFLSDKTLGT